MIQGQRAMPILSVKDVEKSTDFFTQGLGFHLAGQWADEDESVSFSIVVMDHLTIGLSRDKDAVGSSKNWAAYFYVADIDAFAAQILGNGVLLHRDLINQVYGCRDLEIADLDGHILCFGQDMAPGEKGPGL